ncbi:MAG TPA: FHA domain-containing protein [Chloroflexi bacterium]|nr:FHA domain-containing protein [Chloroflexota bacterium]
MASKLVVKKGPGTGTSYTLDQAEIFVGRDLGNDIVVNDAEISRRHARLYKHGDNFMIEDLGSTNGTIVNGQKIRGPKELTNHDYVAMGQNIGYEFIDDKPMSYEANTIAVDKMDEYGDATIVGDDSQRLIPEEEDYAAPIPEIPSEFAQVPQQSQPHKMPAQDVPPATAFPASPAKPKKKFPIWILILVILLFIICLCGGLIWYIDSQNLWCEILTFLPGCPVTY